MEDLVGQIGQGVGLGHDQTGFGLAQDQQGVAGLNAEEGAGLLGDHDLSPVAHLGGAEYPLLSMLAEDVFPSGHFITSFILFILFTPADYNEIRPGCQVRDG